MTSLEEWEEENLELKQLSMKDTSTVASVCMDSIYC
jgi:hypothetical protein